MFLNRRTSYSGGLNNYRGGGEIASPPVNYQSLKPGEPGGAF